MNIRCESCSRRHDVDPPEWVVSSGRGFRFRCAACGHSQSVLAAQATPPEPLRTTEGPAAGLSLHVYAPAPGPGSARPSHADLHDGEADPELIDPLDADLGALDATGGEDDPVIAAPGGLVAQATDEPAGLPLGADAEATTVRVAPDVTRHRSSPRSHPLPLVAQVEMFEDAPAPPRRSPSVSAEPAISWEALHEGLDLDEDFDELPHQRGRSWLPSAAIALGAAGLLGYFLLGGQGAGLVEILGPAPGGLVAQAAAPAEPPSSEPEGASPQPTDPAPEPAPAPPAPPASNDRLVSQGWSQYDDDPEAARRAFGEVLERDPEHDGANYGYGYVLLMRSHPDAAEYLCRARDARDPEVRQDVVGLIASYDLSCP